MTHYTTNGTAFLSTTTPFHSCATELTFPVFRCASHPQLCNVDTVMSTEVGLIESRTNRASTGMQTPTGRPDAPFASFEAARAWFPPCQSTGASPRATGGCILPRADTRHSHANVCRALQARHRQCSRAAAFLGPHQRISFSRCLIVSAATHHVARIYTLSISTAPDSAHRAWNSVRSIRAFTDLSLASRSSSPLCLATADLATPPLSWTTGAPPRGVPPAE